MRRFDSSRQQQDFNTFFRLPKGTAAQAGNDAGTAEGVGEVDMISKNIDGNTYRLPGGLTDFQEKMYVRLIHWKREHVTEAPGEYLYKGRVIQYDAILPACYGEQELLPHVYEPIIPHLAAHRKKNPFRLHEHFFHMASSQVANINLFLPILHSPHVNQILGRLKKDFKALATDQLDQGYCIEYWGDNYRSGGKGPLGDKSAMAGTDSDIAIAYRNHDDALCLWLIEHKLTEREFTTCGGYKSKGRKERHDCSKRFSDIIQDKHTCYYHDVRKFKYWNITESHQGFFANHMDHEQCPFQGGEYSSGGS